MIESEIQDAHAETERFEGRKTNSLDVQLKNLLGSCEAESLAGGESSPVSQQIALEESLEESFEQSVEQSVEIAVDNLEQTLANALETSENEVCEQAPIVQSEQLGSTSTEVLADETVDPESILAAETADAAESAEEILETMTKLGNDMANIALDEDELETLQDLVVRYDQVVADLDILNKQIESLLASEGIQGCES